jgi:hypothetical protein
MPNSTDHAAEFDAGGMESGFKDLIQKSMPGFNFDSTPKESQETKTAEAERAAEKELTGKEPEVPAEPEAAAEPESPAEPEAPSDPAPEKPAEPEKPAAEAKQEPEKPAEGDDKDLDDIAKDLKEPHVRPKTRQIAEKLKAEAKKARVEAREIAKQKSDLEKKVADLESKVGAASPELQKEVEQLRLRLQEFDATADPELIKKYDQPIAANNDAIIGILHQFGKFGEGDKPDPKLVDTFKAKGLTLKNLDDDLKEMEKQRFPDEAAAIRDAVLENYRLARDKEREIQAIRGNAAERIAARNKQAENATASRDKAIYSEATPILASDLETLSKEFSYLRKPDPPLKKDTPDVAKAKNAALAEYEATDKEIGDVVLGFNATGKTGPEQVKAQARMVAHAIQAVILKTRLVPKLQSDMKTKDKLIADLQAQLAKYRKAGDITRAHGAEVGKSSKTAEPMSADTPTAEAFEKFARQAGVAV